MPRSILGSPPAPILMVGLQGSGKTTTSAKLGLLLQTREKKRVLMASLDVTRPAAMEQLHVLGEQAGVATLPDRCRARARSISPSARWPSAKVGGYDVLILDTAGRQHIDEQLMTEVAQRARRRSSRMRRCWSPTALTGQDAVNIAKSFNERVDADRHHPDARRWRCARRRGAVDARGHRRADQVPRRRRKARRARSRSIPRAWPRASSTWAMSSRWSRRRPRRFDKEEGREARRQDEEGSVRHERSRRASSAR